MSQFIDLCVYYATIDAVGSVQRGGYVCVSSMVRVAGMNKYRWMCVRLLSLDSYILYVDQCTMCQATAG